jgi:hypothetical protein
VAKVVFAEPRAVALEARDRSSGGHVELRVSGGTLAADYTFCSDNACLDHAGFKFPALTQDKKGSRFLSGSSVVASYDGKGAIKLAPGVTHDVSIVRRLGQGGPAYDEVSLTLTIPQ